jgi:hypothetical protein
MTETYKAVEVFAPHTFRMVERPGPRSHRPHRRTGPRRVAMDYWTARGRRHHRRPRWGVPVLFALRPLHRRCTLSTIAGGCNLVDDGGRGAIGDGAFPVAAAFADLPRIAGFFSIVIRAIPGLNSRRLRHPLSQKMRRVPTCPMFGAFGGYNASLSLIPKLDVAPGRGARSRWLNIAEDSMASLERRS